MRRRTVLASGATTFATLIAGCGGDDTDDGTPTPEEFDATIEFTDCSTVTVDAEEYSAVALSLVNGSTEMNDEGYAGEETFEGSQAINEVVVWGPGGTDDAFQPDGEDCTE